MAGENNFCKYNDLLYYDKNGSKNNGNLTPIYGPYEKLHLSDWGQSNIHHEIVQAFNKMNIKQMKPIQQNSFLYLMNHYNTAMVGFSKGKSISYLASICSSVLSNSNDEMKSFVIGPKAIILSSSLASCSRLEYLSNELFSSTIKKNNVAIAYESISVQHTIAALCNGCDILIATPTGLHNLLTQTKMFNYSNLKHFVFDNIDLLLDNYKNQMPHFLQILTELKKKEEKYGIQLISTSVKWNKDVDIFLNQLFVKWQYIFGSPLEAARYMKIGFNLVQVKDDKLEKILEFLKNNTKYLRSVLVTSDSDELGIISSYIQQHDSSIEVLVPNQMRISNVYTLQQWNEPLEKNQRVLICSDNMMIDLYVVDADCLIHYDIPTDKHKFSIRFSVLDNSNNVFINKRRSSYIFLSNNIKDMLQLPKVVEVMKDFGNGEVDPILLKHAKNINDSLEKEKKNCLLCSEILQFGYCSKPMTCQSRHILFKQVDDPGVNIPRSGLAIVKILNVYDASHMSAKLLKLNCTNTLNDEQYWSNVIDHSDTINHKLNSHFSKRDSEVLHEKPNPGDIVAVQIDSSTRKINNTAYFRALVINVVDKNTTNPKVKVKLIDEGYVETISKWKVFVLPDMLKSIHTTIVDMFLASVKPIGFDKTWCAQANHRLIKHLKDVTICNNTIIVKVKMALGTTIWIQKLYEKYWDSNLKKYEFKEILPEILLNNGYADINFEHIDNLRELSISAGISKPLQIEKNFMENKELSIEEFMSIYKLPQPQWAHLDQSVTLVSVDCIISHKLFFVGNNKYYDRLDNLQLMIDKYIEEKQLTKLKHIINGALCLAKYPKTDKFNRVKIIEKSGNGFVEVLFVDKAEFLNIKIHFLLTIHPDLITYLPFQAIECSLSGVNDKLPTNNELDELVGYLFDIMPNSLYLKVINTISSTTYTGGSHYEVMLYDADITVNLEFQTKFSQYCDDFQMSELLNIINTEYNKDTSIEDDKNIPYVFDEKKFEIEDMNPDELKIEQEFFDKLGTVVFGEAYANMFKRADQNIVDVKKEDFLKITDMTPVNENGPPKVCANIEPIKTKEISPNNDTAILNDMYELNNCKQKLKEKRRNICLTCNTNIRSIIPVCTWHEDRNNIYLKLHILEIDNFNVDCTMEGIKFKSQFKNFSYEFCVRLYGLILDKSITYRHNYEGFHIKAEKLYKTDYKWPQLFLCRKYHTYLKYDTEHIEIKDFSFWTKEMNKFKVIAKGTPLNSMNDECSSTDSCDDSENEEHFDYDDFIDY
ncbi:PREDICTED: putative ATP-dependent RNA helicase TDRD12 [Diuraphis noxia]|uniref:putative ATP-dependent RNA helicase TDRD12 n=1 Tax=Diuraphis noxia TaxID=143948 RepID=UPI0007635FC3|nr:PREDICTED: putative ATP-dependent RNA helicase TDRD12 [Diuraphis noxia]